jgi:hypothetical protein
MQRREFVKGSVALAGSWAVGTASASAARRRSRIDAVIYDERFADARRFAAVLARAGTALLPARSNIVQLWYDTPARMTLANAACIAGFMTQSDWTIARAVLKCRGLSVLYEGTHDGRSMAGLTHRFEGIRRRNLATRVSAAGAAWASSIADELALPLASESEAHTARTVAASRSSDFPGTLVSWLLGAA